MISEMKKAVQASRELALMSNDKINQVLEDIAQAIINQQSALLNANQKDLKRMDKKSPKYDRLQLSQKRLQDIARALLYLKEEKNPVGEVMAEKTLENGIHLQKVRVPLGVLGIVFEARPNVFFDCFALSFKSKNACILKGSRDAENSNTAIFKLIQGVLQEHKINPYILVFAESTEQALQEILGAHGLIEAIIPRGGQNLINFVRENSQVPVIETGAGIVHAYLEETADLTKAQNIIQNAKVQRPSVCNALDCLIVHEARLKDLPKILAPLAEKNVQIWADEKSFRVLSGKYPYLQNEENFGREFLGYEMSIKTVANIKEALEHIAQYSSRHTELILTENKKVADDFVAQVDAAAVFVNASTRFTDGEMFGLGAEIGISTQKLHARGPMGLREITTYKWVGRGDGQVRV